MRAASAVGLSLALAALTATSAAAGATAAQPEAQIRHRIEAGVSRAAAAKSFTSRDLVEIPKIPPNGRLVPILRIESRVEGGATLKTDARRYPPGRWTPQPTNQVLTVGDRAWWRAQTGTYREATIEPKFAESGGRELTELAGAIAATKHLRRIGADRYELTAPATTFNGPEVAGYPPVRLVVALGADGRLHRLRRIEEQGGLLLIATETLTEFGHHFGITAPPPAVISPAPVKHITKPEEFSALFGRNLFGD